MVSTLAAFVLGVALLQQVSELPSGHALLGVLAVAAPTRAVGAQENDLGTHLFSGCWWRPGSFRKSRRGRFANDRERRP